MLYKYHGYLLKKIFESKDVIFCIAPFIWLRYKFIQSRLLFCNISHLELSQLRNNAKRIMYECTLLHSGLFSQFKVLWFWFWKCGNFTIFFFSQSFMILILKIYNKRLRVLLNPFRTKKMVYSLKEINLYCIIKLATEISIFSSQISRTWSLCVDKIKYRKFGNPFQSKKLPICT